MAADVLVETRKGLKKQITSLFRHIFKFSGGRVDIRQHDIETNYTTSQNASLCVNLLGIFCLRQFERFDTKEMQIAFFKSKLFAKLLKSDILDVLEWKLRIIILVPVGFSNNYLV